VSGENALKKQSESPAFGRKSEALSSKYETTFDRLNLKKQSQFVPRLLGVTSFEKGAYDDISPAGDVKNKANRTIERGPI